MSQRHAIPKRLPRAFALTVLTALLLSSSPAIAGNGFDPNYRYCLQSAKEGAPDIPDCAFNSLDQCRMTANGQGSCMNNPIYSGAAVPKARARAAR